MDATLGCVSRCWVGGRLAAALCLPVEADLRHDAAPVPFWAIALVGGLDASHSRRLQRLPCRAVGGRLTLAHCPQLTSLPSGLVVGGDLILDGCVALDALPRGLRVRGSLSMEQCRLLTALPAGLRVGGTLRVAGWQGLSSLPDGVRVGEDLDASDCRQLAVVGRGLRVGRELDLSGCLSLTRLAQVHVGGDLVLTGCQALRQLPDKLKVGGDLDLAGCSALAELPAQLEVGGDLNLERCAALRSIPAAVLAWPPRAASSDDETGSRLHEVRLAGSGLGREALAWLRETQPPNVRFLVSAARDDAAKGSGFASLSDAVAFWTREARGSAEDGDAALRMALSRREERVLARFLGRLREAKEFAVTESRLALAQRVAAVLEGVAAGGDARDELLRRAEDSLDACGDKPVWALNQMGVLLQVVAARGDRERLRRLGKRVMRLMIVQEHAKRKVDVLKWVDDVCVYLVFEIHLREPLDLPVAASAMLYPSYVDVEPAELLRAKRDALAITEAQFAAWLQEWPEWQRQLRLDLASKTNWAELRPAAAAAGGPAPPAPPGGFTNLVGDPCDDPVQRKGGGAVWSLSDLMRHWVPTGLDLNNAPLEARQVAEEFVRVC